MISSFKGKGNRSIYVCCCGTKVIYQATTTRVEKDIVFPLGQTKFDKITLEDRRPLLRGIPQCSNYLSVNWIQIGGQVEAGVCLKLHKFIQEECLVQCPHHI